MDPVWNVTKRTNLVNACFRLELKPVATIVQHSNLCILLNSGHILISAMFDNDRVNCLHAI